MKGREVPRGFLGKCEEGEGNHKKET